MQLIAMFNQSPQPAMAAVGEISGTYSALVNGSECVLKLWFNGEGFVCGSFQAEGEILELRGGYSNRLGSVHGFLLEPFGHIPVAMFSAESTVQGLSFSIGVPEFDSLLVGCDLEQISFSRVSEPEPQLWGGGQ